MVLGEKVSEKEIIDEFNKIYYRKEQHTWREMFWLGVKVFNNPCDIWMFQEIIFDKKPTKYLKEEPRRCSRCHAGSGSGESVNRQYEFASFLQKFPRERFGNGVDWEKAEELGLIRPIDYLEGVSVKRPPLATQKDFAIAATVENMPEIIFSHRKHTVWNGCELCHPEIFPSMKKGATKYSMTYIFEGKYCGACHVTVAFPTTDSQRCHTKPVR